MRADLDTLEARIGHRFADRAILERALTHSSHAYEQTLAGAAPQSAGNEQMEFLGDSVLGFIASEYLVRRFPEYREGRLSKLKHHLVSAVHLHGVAQILDLGTYLQLGRSEEMSGGRTKRTLLVDALEALIAAIYLDGGIGAVREFVCRIVIAAAGETFGQDSGAMPAAPVDYKSALQELAQARRLAQPRYSIVKERGPEHSKTFTVEVRIGKEWSATAEGMSKKSAAQKAAREVYDRILAAVPTA